MPTLSSFTAYEAADAIKRDAARASIKLIADTLTTQFPGAAYLTAEWDCENVKLLSVLDANGSTLHWFNFRLDENFRPVEPLPPLPDGSPMLQEWLAAGQDPCSPFVIESLICRLMEDGMLLEDLPDDLPDEDAPAEVECVPLSDQARLSPSSARPFNRVLRPYSTEGPAHPQQESPVSELLPVLGSLGMQYAVRTGIELYGTYGDPDQVLRPGQVGILTAAAEHFGREDADPDDLVGLTGAEVLSTLLGVPDDHQAQAVREAARATRLLWQCQSETCGTDNASTRTCDGCGQPREGASNVRP